MNFRRVPALPRQYSANMKQLIESMLTVDASKRPSISDLLEHKCLKPRIERLMSTEEIKEEFDHTVLHNAHVLGSGSKGRAPAPRAPSGIGSHQARPYSARSGQSNRSRVEEAKQPASKPVGAARGYGVGSDRRAPKPADRSGAKPIGSRAVGSKAVDRSFGSKAAPSGSKRSPVKQTPKFGMGARKNSEGMLHAHKHKMRGGLVGNNNGIRQNSPRNKAANFHYNKGLPNPSQTPRNNGAVKKLAGAAPVGFQKQRPSSAAYGMYKANSKYQKPLGQNNGRIFR